MSVVRQELDGSPIVFEASGMTPVQGPGTDDWTLIASSTLGATETGAPAGGYTIPANVWQHSDNGDSESTVVAAFGAFDHLERDIWFRESGDFRVTVMGYRPSGGNQQFYASLDSLTTAVLVSFGTPNASWHNASQSSAGIITIAEPGVFKFRVVPRTDGVVVARVAIYKDGNTTPENELVSGPLSQIVDNPTFGSNGQYESIPLAGSDTEIPLADPLAAGAVPGLVAGEPAALLNPGPLQLSNDGVITNTASNALTYTIKAFDPTIGATGEYVTLTGIAPGTGATLDSLTVDSDVYAGRTFTVTTTATDLTSHTAADLRIVIDGATLPIATIAATNPGAITAVLPEAKAGLLLRDGAAFSLELANGTQLATGTGDLTERPSGSLITPATTADAEVYPESNRVDSEGDPELALQIEDHGDDTYSVLFESWEGPFGTVGAISPTLDIGAAGDYNWPNPPWTNFDAVQWESTGTGLRIKGAAVTPLSRIIYNDSAINADVISATITATLNSQDHMSAGLSQDDGASIFAKYVGGGRFDLFYVTPSGAQNGLKQATLSTPPQGEVALAIRWSNSTNTAAILVNNFELLSVAVPSFAPIRASILAVGENQNSSEVTSFEFLGVTDTVIRSLNNTVSIPSVREGDSLDIEWTNSNNVSSYTLTDEKGNTSTLNATALSANEDRIASLDILGLWYGLVTIDDGEGNTRQFDYIPPAGIKYQNLDSTLDLTGSTANWAPSSQIRYQSQSVQNNGVDITSRGIINIGGDFLQYVNTQETTGNGVYEPSQRDWVFQDIREDFADFEERNFASGADVAINLQTAYNQTVEVPADEEGTAGFIDIDLTLPAGLTRTDGLITGTLPNGLYTIPITVTDPAGNAQSSTLVIGVGQARVNSLTVTGVMPTSATITADVDSFSGSGAYVFFVVALPLGAVIPIDAQVLAGTDANGASVPSNSVSAANGITGTVIQGLTPNIDYIYRVVAVASNGQHTAQTLDNDGEGFRTPAPAQTPFAGSRSKKSNQSRIASNRKANTRR